MAVQVSYPGVYIDEFAPGAPIQGVGTSVAAFIGVAASGDVNIPTKVTSLDQFLALYGNQPVPGFYLWYSVRGFFENGGKVCYIVRASNGSKGTGVLTDSANPAIALQAVKTGTTSVKVTATQVHLLPATPLYAPISNFLIPDPNNPSDITVTKDDGTKFKPGDSVLLNDGADHTAQILRVNGDSLRLVNAVTKKPGTIRLANTVADTTRTIRLGPGAPLAGGVLVPGTMLTITQGASETQMVDSVQVEPGVFPNPPTYRVTFRQALKSVFNLDPANNLGAPTATSHEFKLVVSSGGKDNTYDNLSIDPVHTRYFVNMINGIDEFIVAQPAQPPTPTPPPDNLPKAGDVTLTGTDEYLPNLGDADFTNALDTLVYVPDVNLVAVPGNGSNVVRQAVIAHCELMADRFGVLDPRLFSPPFNDANSIENQRHSVDSTRGYAALYYPWLMVPPAGAGPPIAVPPSGHVCGIMARVDATRGVHKAPANEIVNGALDVQRTVNDQDQGILNLEGINVVRVFRTGGRPILWGARTTATDTNWQYVNIRRLFLFLEKSIQEGIRWAVFEPNNTGLWEKLRRTITDFLTRVWRDGGLFGETADKAFYVRIDEALNPDSERALGRLHIEIGVRPSYPAEFIIVRIGIWYGGSQVTEG